VPETINMWHRFAGATRIGADRRIEYGDADIRIGKGPLVELPPPKVTDADAVALADRFEWPFPEADPVRVEHETKLREQVPEFAVLLFD
jgi:hypothetical protein